MLPVLLGKSDKGRSVMVEESFVLSLRMDSWKYITPGNKAPDWLKNKDVESGLMGTPQLFDLSKDPSEHKNLLIVNTAQAGKMDATLNQIIKEDRSRP